MKQKPITLSMLALATALVSFGCARTADKPQPSPDPAPQPQRAEAQRARDDVDQATSREDGLKQQEDERALNLLRDAQRHYTDEINRDIVEADDQVGILQNASSWASGATKTDYDHALEDLALRRETLRADLPAISDATVADWPSVRARVDNDLDDANKSLRAAFARTKDMPRKTATAR